ncbi:MAG: hypothetical protein QOJ51_5845 [Acidobacteriaceae bacterium]|jgi:hypothetical protein|nr:hypothetical protein [Acidobacteriaceae bacterium]
MQTSKSVSLLLAATFAAIAGTAYGAQPPDVGVSGVTTGLAGTALSGGSDAVPKPLATIRHNFRGSTRDCGSDGYQFPPGGSYCDKPDTSGAIGPHYFVELVNNHYAVYTKQGIPVVQMTGGEFWGQAGVPFGVDEAPLGPSIAFDSTEGRWYASAINAASDGLSQGTDLRIAVSRGDDPTEGFIGFKIHLHDLNVANGDPPVMGYNGSGVFLTSFDFDADFNPTGFTLVVLPKSDLLARKPRIDRRTVFQNIFFAAAGEFLVPTIDLDGGEQDEIVLSTEGNIQYTYGTYKRNDVRGNIFAPHFDVGSGYPNGYFFGRNDFNTFFAAPQPDPNALPLGPNFLIANTAPVKVNGQIWMATNTVDPGTGRGTIHWLRIDAASTTIIEEGFIADATQSFLFPSIAANQHGDVVIGFNAVGTGPSQFVSSYAVVGKTAGRRKTVFGDPMLLQHGLASYQLPTDVGTASWGDYSRTTLDPEDDKTFWTIQQVAVDTTHWATQITALHIEH